MRQNAAGNALDQRLLPVGIVCRRWNAVCANRPDGLVGEQDVRIQRRVFEKLQGAPHLPDHHLLGSTGLALGKRLADADQRHQAVPHSGGSLQADGAIRLAEVLAPLAVAELDKVEPAVLQHQRRDLAGPGAGIRPVHVLRTNLHPSRGQFLLHLAHHREGGDDEGLNAFMAFRCKGQQRLREGKTFGQGLVHLPAGADPATLHGRPFRFPHAAEHAIASLVITAARSMSKKGTADCGETCRREQLIICPLSRRRPHELC